MNEWSSDWRPVSGNNTSAPEPIVKTLRDEIAMAAMAGLIANPNTPDQLIGLGFSGAKDLVADYSYAMADAMLKARKETN